MKPDYLMYGWELSYFSGKLRGYLRYKGVDFKEKAVNAYDLTKRIPQKTGASVMPVLKTRGGEWLQDTSAIIDELERRHPEPSISPPGPRQKIAAQIIEAWADEYWIPSAMHYRWNFAENFELFEREAGKNLLPFAPRFLRDKAVAKPAKFLRGVLPGVGVAPENEALIEHWTNHQLDLLETHFTQHRYLLGDRPSIGDFGLIGPLYAHLGRDPAPKRDLIDKRPNLQAWINRVHNGEAAAGNWLANDEIPATLTPLLNGIFTEFGSMVGDIAKRVEQHVEQHGLTAGDKLPRSLKTIRVPMANGKISRAAMPYTLWMMQRVAASYAAFDIQQHGSVDNWLLSHNHPTMSEFQLGPKLERRALATRLAR